MKRIMAITLLLTLLLTGTGLPAYAVQTLDVTVDVTPEITKVGETVTVTVCMEGYTGSAEGICGLQIDVAHIDPQKLQVISYQSLVSNASADMNDVEYQTESQNIRLVYAQLDRTALASCDQMLQIVFRIPEDLADGSEIILPVTVLVQTVTQQLTFTKQCRIEYAQEISNVNSVEIAWGALTYTYTDGVWNPETYTYDGASWEDNGSGFVTVKNCGQQATTAKFLYTPVYEKISGSFTDGSVPVTEVLLLEAGQEQTVFLVLSGRPEQNLNNAKVGTLTVEIGGE